jgi:hypothetical protein
MSGLSTPRDTTSGTDGTSRAPSLNFLPSTWHGLGGRGLPQNASASTQWAMAEKLYHEAGTSPWYASKPCWSHHI